MDNPFESPSETGLDPKFVTAELRGRVGRDGVQSKHFRILGLFLFVIGCAVTLPAALITFVILNGIFNKPEKGWTLQIALAIALGVLLCGVLLIVVGRGLMNTRPWAWAAAAMLCIPAVAIFLLASLILTPQIPMLLLIVAANGGVIFFMGWTLFSNSGRDRYRLIAESITRLESKNSRTSALIESFPAETNESTEAAPSRPLEGWLNDLGESSETHGV